MHSEPNVSGRTTRTNDDGFGQAEREARRRSKRQAEHTRWAARLGGSLQRAVLEIIDHPSIGRHGPLQDGESSAIA